ncbi:MAG: phosphotransferase [Proteobacteria bacterium]|nr:phosphotransferase [Pseudomonadota bacterium]
MLAQKLEIEPALCQMFAEPPGSWTLKPLQGDASTRSYYRLTLQPELSPNRLIVMQLAGSQAPDAGAQDRELPFLNVQRFLERRGVPVPRVYAQDLARNVVLLEDLGDETMEVRLRATAPEHWTHRYAEAVDLLVYLQQRCAEPDRGCVAYQRCFDAELLRWELDHFRQWGLEAVYGRLPASDRRGLDADFDELVQLLLGMATGFVHRDFQCRNLMWASTRSPERLTVIDFQDALIGPRPYDLVALLCDSYVCLSPDLQQAMLDRYLSASGLSRVEAERFELAFWRTALQRKLKDAGRFIYLDRMRANRSFLRWFPQSLVYVGRALERLGELPELELRLKRSIPGFPGPVPVPQSVCDDLAAGGRR